MGHRADSAFIQRDTAGNIADGTATGFRCKIDGVI